MSLFNFQFTYSFSTPDKLILYFDFLILNPSQFTKSLSGEMNNNMIHLLREKKIMKSSFLDDSFRKNLESALRFGNPILVQDCENYDAILNPVLNRELRRTGGRLCDSPR